MTSLLRSIDLTSAYGRKDVVLGVSLEAKSGEVVGLLGPNGAGKTTTFSMVAGFVRPTQGKVFLDELDLTNLPAYQRARNGLVYLPQDSSVFRKLTVEENVRAIVETLGLSKAKEMRWSRKGWQNCLSELASQKAFTLSGRATPA